jgi:hypothetical protein
MSSDDSEECRFPSIESYTPGYSLNAIDAWHIVFGECPADALDNVAEVEYYAKNPHVLARTLAKDFAKLITVNDSGRTDEQYAGNFLLWSFSPLIQSGRYYRLLSSLIPSCPFTFAVFVKLGDAWRSGDKNAIAEVIEEVREEVASFSLWVEFRFPVPEETDGDEKKQNAATFEDVELAMKEIERQGGKPTREQIGAYLRSIGLRVGSERLNLMKKRIEMLSKKPYQ